MRVQHGHEKEQLPVLTVRERTIIAAVHPVLTLTLYSQWKVRTWQHFTASQFTENVVWNFFDKWSA